MNESGKNEFLSFGRRIFFDEIGNKLRPGCLKGFINFAYIIFEKIALNFENLSTFYLDVYSEIVEKELSLLNILENDKILIIGGGSIPATPILIAKKINIKITSLDIDKKAVEKSNKYIEKLKLKGKINIIYGDGENYPIKDYDIIYILYGMKSQMRILNYVSKNINENSRVIMRVITKQNKALIDNIPVDLSDYFKIENKVKSHSLGLLDSYLLSKKK